jgi:hypothetical protein
MSSGSYTKARERLGLAATAVALVWLGWEVVRVRGAEGGDADGGFDGVRLGMSAPQILASFAPAAREAETGGDGGQVGQAKRAEPGHRISLSKRRYWRRRRRVRP